MAGATTMAVLSALASLAGGVAGGLAEPDSPAEIQDKRLRDQVTKPGFDDFGPDLARQQGPNLSLQNARRGVAFRGY